MPIDDSLLNKQFQFRPYGLNIYTGLFTQQNLCLRSVWRTQFARNRGQAAQLRAVRLQIDGVKSHQQYIVGRLPGVGLRRPP